MKTALIIIPVAPWFEPSQTPYYAQEKRTFSQWVMKFFKKEKNETIYTGKGTQIKDFIWTHKLINSTNYKSLYADKETLLLGQSIEDNSIGQTPFGLGSTTKTQFSQIKHFIKFMFSHNLREHDTFYVLAIRENTLSAHRTLHIHTVLKKLEIDIDTFITSDPIKLKEKTHRGIQIFV